MPTKAEQYAQMADKVQHSSRGAGRNGQGFSLLLPAFTSTRSMSS